ncbi:hypothetical protein Bxe_A3940 [Paraburkholderia xenovorans LB400]|uniref:Uncharacterized protein n=1 Tax=Paraburkholderia xenovorans (strain LB400) TaxID=266265 RepID=Q145D0_PARXL|nr:hypothetical protein Bxe_A3940 [Paraburkholderia xenovorans LB400]
MSLNCDIFDAYKSIIPKNMNPTTFTAELVRQFLAENFSKITHKPTLVSREDFDDFIHGIVTHSELNELAKAHELRKQIDTTKEKLALLKKHETVGQA